MIIRECVKQVAISRVHMMVHKIWCVCGGYVEVGMYRPWIGRYGVSMVGLVDDGDRRRGFLYFCYVEGYTYKIRDIVLNI